MSHGKRLLAAVLAFSIGLSGSVHAAPAVQQALIATEQVAATQPGSSATAQEARARALAQLDRADVAAALAARGVDAAQARERVGALTDDEALRLADALDRAPAGGDVIGTIVFIFVLLLITDILGFTKIFPFTRPVR